MFKIIFFILSILFMVAFDNKTGIWTGSIKIAKENNNDQNLELIFKKKRDTKAKLSENKKYLLQLQIHFQYGVKDIKSF